MLENRISQFLPAAVFETGPNTSGFMAYPVQGWSGQRQAWLGEIYRIALERALADAQPSPWFRRVMSASVN